MKPQDEQFAESLHQVAHIWRTELDRRLRPLDFSHSRWLLLFRQAMYEQSQRYRMLSLKTRPFPRAQSAREHKEILDAALARDSDRAVALLQAHILKGAQTVSVSEDGHKNGA